MQVSLDHNSGAYAIRSYTPGQITISTPVHRMKPAHHKENLTTENVYSSIIVAPDRIIKDWPPQFLNNLTKEYLNLIVDLDPELILLGTGAKHEFPDVELTAHLWDSHIGVEIMDTAAACRTFNILVNEGRYVVAGLIIN